MGHIHRKIDHLASNLFRHHCVGEPRFLNRKIICGELSKIILDYCVEFYHQNSTVFRNQLVSHITELMKGLQGPLMIVKSELSNKYRIDLATNSLTTELNNFFNSSHKTLHRNMKTILKKKNKLQKFKDKYQADDSSLSTISQDSTVDSFPDETEWDDNDDQMGENLQLPEELYEELELVL